MEEFTSFWPIHNDLKFFTGHRTETFQLNNAFCILVSWLCIDSHCEHLNIIIQSLETLDGGKPYHDAYADVEHAIDVYKYYGGLADKIGGKTIAPGKCNYYMSEVCYTLCVISYYRHFSAVMWCHPKAIVIEVTESH